MKPSWRVNVDSAPASAVLEDRLLQVRVQDEAGVRSDSCTLTFDDRAPSIALPTKGVSLKVSLGFGEELWPMGEFVVDEVTAASPPRRLTVKARAANFSGGGVGSQLRTAVRRSWHNTTLGHVLGDVAGAAGHAVEVAAELAERVVEHVDQVNESGLAFVTRLSGQYGFVAKVAAGALLAVPRGGGRSVSGAPLPKITIRADECSRWEGAFPERNVFPAATARWHDVRLGVVRELRVGAAEGEAVAVGREYWYESDARAAAEAALRNGQVSRAALSLALSVGNPRVLAETRLNLEGFRDGIDGEWSTTAATHDWSRAGATSSIRAEAV